jgi:hypothetical protein
LYYLTWFYQPIIDCPGNDITAVCVFRHNAMPFALEDGLEQYNRRDLQYQDNRTKAQRSVIHTNMELLLTVLESKMQDRGAMFCVCNLAISVYSGMVENWPDRKRS